MGGEDCADAWLGRDAAVEGLEALRWSCWCPLLRPKSLAVFRCPVAATSPMRYRWKCSLELCPRVLRRNALQAFRFEESVGSTSPSRGHPTRRNLD